jgi:hypothetical protein
LTKFLLATFYLSLVVMDVNAESFTLDLRAQAIPPVCDYKVALDVRARPEHIVASTKWTDENLFGKRNTLPFERFTASVVLCCYCARIVGANPIAPGNAYYRVQLA